MRASVKWQAYGMPAEIYKKHPEFSRFVVKSPLLNQIKVTRDRSFESDGKAALLVEGKPMTWPELKNRFETAYSKKFDETFIVDRVTRDVYTYLDDGNGLQKHHPFLSNRKVISKINSEEFNGVLQCAQRFIRSGEEKLSAEERQKANQQRLHVLQVVSSWRQKGSTNVHKLLMNPDHPYIRLIAGRENQELNMQMGEVYSVGYRSKNKITFPFLTAKGVKKPQFFPFIATKGVFRSPDLAEYIPCHQRFVTNIAVTDAEAEAFYKFTEKYHKESINLGNTLGFHLASQNCTTYIRKALLTIGIQAPSEISAAQIIKRISPDWFKEIARGVRRAKQSFLLCAGRVGQILPSNICAGIGKIASLIAYAVKRFFDLMAALPISMVHLLLGDASGEGGKAFVVCGEAACEIKPGLSNWKKWSSLSHYRFHVPGVLQEWQRLQSSTVVYQNPIHLTLGGFTPRPPPGGFAPWTPTKGPKALWTPFHKLRLANLTLEPTFRKSAIFDSNLSFFQLNLQILRQY